MSTVLSHSHRVYIDGVTHWVNHRHVVTDLDHLEHPHRFEAGEELRVNTQQLEAARRRAKK